MKKCDVSVVGHSILSNVLLNPGFYLGMLYKRVRAKIRSVLEMYFEKRRLGRTLWSDVSRLAVTVLVEIFFARENQMP